MVETLGPLQENHEAFKEGATFKSAPYWSFCELHLPAGLLEVPGRLRLYYYRGLNQHVLPSTPFRVFSPVRKKTCSHRRKKNITRSPLKVFSSICISKESFAALPC